MNNDQVLFLSFNPSGSNWARYCIDYFSAMPAPGGKRDLHISRTLPRVERKHFVKHWHRLMLQAYQAPRPGTKQRRRPASIAWERFKELSKLARLWKVARTRRVLLVLRDPLDLYVRVGATDPRALIGYAGNIRLFDSCRRSSLCIHYEDLIARSTERSELERMLTFLDIRHDLSDFDFEEHRRRSIELYDRHSHRPFVRGVLSEDRRRANRLSSEQAKRVERYLRGQLGGRRFDQYLGRYFVRAEPAPKMSAIPMTQGLLSSE